MERTKIVRVYMTPTLKSRVKAKAALLGMPMNELIGIVLDDFLAGDRQIQRLQSEEKEGVAA